MIARIETVEVQPGIAAKVTRATNRDRLNRSRVFQMVLSDEMDNAAQARLEEYSRLVAFTRSIEFPAEISYQLPPLDGDRNLFRNNFEEWLDLDGPLTFAWLTAVDAVQSQPLIAPPEKNVE